MSIIARVRLALIIISALLLLLASPALVKTVKAQVSWQIYTVESLSLYMWHYTSIALDSNDYPHIAYKHNGPALRYASYNGSTWSYGNPDPACSSAGYTSLALDSNDRPHISYLDGSPSSDNNLKYAYHNGTTWSATTVDEDAFHGYFSSIAVNSANQPHIGYWDQGQDDLEYMYKSSGTWYWENLDFTGNVGSYTSLALDSTTGNYPHISYYDATNGNLKYYNGAVTSSYTVDGGPPDNYNVGEYTSIALDSNNNPHISYYDATNKDLKYAYYDGSSWSVESVDWTDNVGKWTSIALGEFDNPYISYYDATNKALKCAYYISPQWYIHTVDSVDIDTDVGTCTSIAIDSRGYPHISYSDITNGQIKYATLATPVVNSVNPDSGLQGETLDVTISGRYFAGATDVQFGGGITVNNFTVDNDAQISANISISDHETPGPKTVQVITPCGMGQKSSAFTVNSSAPTVAFDATSSSGDEGTTPANLAVSLSATSGLTVTVDYAVTAGGTTASGGGVDYTLLGIGTLTFSPEDTSEDISITVVDDTMDEANETVQVTLSSPFNASLGTNTVHTYTINDNDDPPTLAFDATSSSGDEGTTPADLSVSLSTTSGLTVTVDYAVNAGGTTATGGGVDYTLLGIGTLTFSPEDTSEDISITVVDDTMDEANETVQVTLSSPFNASLGTNTDHTYTINDNDDPPTVAFDATSSSGDEGTTPANLAVSLSAASGLTVTVDYAVTAGGTTATGGGVDYTLADGTLTFAPDDISEDISITVVDDTMDEANETVQVTLSNPSNATLGTNSHTYTINDNDDPPTVAFDATSSSGDEGTTPADLSVSLSTTSGLTVTVDYAVNAGGTTATGGGVDYTLLGIGTLTFSPEDTSEDISITVVDDTMDEANETVQVTLSSPFNASLGTNTVHTYTINDDDTAGITVDPTTGLVTFEGGGTDTFTVVLDTEPTADVTIDLSSDDTSEGTVSPTSVTFTSGNWDIPQTVTVNGADDDVVDGDIPYTIVTAQATSGDPSYSPINPADVSVTNNDLGVFCLDSNVTITDCGTTDDPASDPDTYDPTNVPPDVIWEDAKAFYLEATGPDGVHVFFITFSDEGAPIEAGFTLYKLPDWTEIAYTIVGPRTIRIELEITDGVVDPPFVLAQQEAEPSPPSPVAVGGEVYPVNKLGILAPWIGLSMLLIGGMTWFSLRRCRARR